MNADPRRKRDARARFNGSPRLFAACWRELLWLERETGERFDAPGEVAAVLDAAAGRRVNNPRSGFWMYGE